MKNQQFKPVIIDNENELKELMEEKPYLSFVDAFSRQIKELFLIDNMEFIGQNKEQVYTGNDLKQYREKKKQDYVYVYYPWNNSIVKCIKHDDYFRLKTNRNQDLITYQEQKKLYDFKVAVLGMSVGSNIAFALTQAGISRKIVVADFDVLDTTNLNRMMAGVHQVGLNKAVIAARRIYEDNPYAEVNLLSEGISKDALERLLENREIECIVEEIDNIGLKIEIRRLAMKYNVPVLMITDNGDGVVFHVERYDLGYNKIFENDTEYWKERITEPLTMAKAGDIIMHDIVGGLEKVDPKMLASVERVLKKELVSWSQLGSAALLGGVVTTVAVKCIVSRENTQLFIKKHIKVPI
jgi:molybdopterin/thiamine biosynthesis adenylyltransferase